MEAQIVRDKINSICGLVECERRESESPAMAGEVDNVRYAPQLLTMNSLNKMLQVRKEPLIVLEAKLYQLINFSQLTLIAKK